MKESAPVKDLARGAARADFLRAKRRAAAARNFPTETDPCSCHAQLLAEALGTRRGYPMLTEEPLHCAASILYTVAMLWELRAEVAALRAKVSPPPPERHSP